MSSPQATDSRDDPRDEPKERLQLSLPQVVGSSAAAVSAAVLCSFFGVAGTVIGTAAASILATVGSAFYSYSLRRTQARLRRLHQAGAASPPLAAVARTAGEQGSRLVHRVPWGIVGLGTANVFVFAIAFVTGLEALLGQSLPAEFGVSHGGADSTSLGSALHSSHHRRHPSTPTPTPATSSTSPSTTPTPTTTRTTPTPTPSSPSSSPTPSGVLPSLLPSSSATASR
jgi:hypothetical protein